MSIMIDLADLLRIRNKVITSLLQLFFWFSISIVVCKVVIVISKGFLPLYTFGFFLIGYIIYRFCLRKRFVRVIEIIRKKLQKTKSRVIKIIFPVELFRNIKKVLKKILKGIIRKKQVEEEQVDVV